MTSSAQRFPIGLTLAALFVIAVCSALGAWQVQRAKWKQTEFARIDALAHAPAQPIGPVLVKSARGEDVGLTRVFADCAAGSTAAGFRVSTDAGDWIARPQAVCLLTVGPFGGVMVDRGIVAASRGEVRPPALELAPPGHVEGVLRAPPRDEPSSKGVHLAPYVLVAEREFPSLPGVTPSPATGQATENLQYVGAYAPTWFGLAGVAACVYAAMLWRRLRPKA